MSLFTEQISIAEEAFLKKDYQAMITALEQAFQVDFLQENLTGQNFEKSYSKAHTLLREIFEFPVLRANQWTQGIFETIEKTTVNYDLFKEIYLLVKGLEQAFQWLESENMTIGKDLDPALRIELEKKDIETISIRFSAKINTQQGGVSQEEVKALQENFFKSFQAEDASPSNLINLAAQLSAKGLYQESIEAYEKLLERYPQSEADVHNGIGANYYFLRQYEKAIAHYLQAYDAGLHPEMADYNVWEACLALIENTSHPEEKKKWKRVYQKNFPEGQHSFD